MNGICPLHLMVISSVRPEPSSGGHILLHRLLQSLPDTEISVFGEEPRRLSPRALLRRIAGRLGRLPGCRWLAETFWVLWNGRWLDPGLPLPPRTGKGTLVLTVAHGDACFAAARYAKKHQLPLVVFFQDWWPDFHPLPLPFKQKLEQRFRALHQTSDLSVCSCPGMLDELGTHPNPLLLPTLTDPQAFLSHSPPPRRDPQGPFRLLYFGNLQEYGPMIARLLEQTKNRTDIRLEVRGSHPHWNPAQFEEMKQRGLWLPHAPIDELAAWAQSADALLICQSFEPDLARRMATSFPSKIGDCCTLAKPLVLWGPPACSGIQWADHGRKALCITHPGAEHVVQALTLLAGDRARQQQLAAAAGHAAQTEFNPESIILQLSSKISALLPPRTSAP